MKPPFETPTMPATASDLELLRRFEPVVRYTRGEQFFPMDIESYIRTCSLWAHYPGGHMEMLVKEGELTLEKITESRQASFGTVLFMRFVEPLTIAESAQVVVEHRLLHRKAGNQFQPGSGRLARGGFLPRLADALFSISLLLRGRVPAATAVAAELAYSALREKDARYIYYGRVVRQSSWIILQYWYFLAYNNWRSRFYGVNDHESDWETATIYLYEAEGQLIPEWVAYAMHEFHGDDLRRRWDDRDELELVDGHPVIYAGAGSHASYFRRGEYQAEVSLPLPRWLSVVTKTWQRFWSQILGLGEAQRNPFRIPFVDYARGDGLSIGVEQGKSWSPMLIDENTPWVSEYRGLWGLYAKDPISGENAPAGPMYNRDGTPRVSWFDPLGFAALDKVPPPPLELDLLEKKIQSIHQRQVDLEIEIPRQSSQLQSMGIELASLEGNPHQAKLYLSLKEKTDILTETVKSLRRAYSENAAVLQSLRQRLLRLKRGMKDAPHAHVHNLVEPVSIARIRFETVTETWAAISLSVLLIALAVLIYFIPESLGFSISILVVTFILVESILRGNFVRTLSSLTTVLAVFTALLLLFHFWRELLLAGLVTLALFLLQQKIRELRT